MTERKPGERDVVLSHGGHFILQEWTRLDSGRGYWHSIAIRETTYEDWQWCDGYGPSGEIATRTPSAVPTTGEQARSTAEGVHPKKEET